MDGLERSESELVVIALPGVQRFITEARSTGDVSAASAVYSRLAGEIVGSLRRESGGDLILPAAGLEDEEQPGVPNRAVALFPSGTGTAAANRAVTAANNAWHSWIRAIWCLPDTASVPETPGFPVLQWACVPAPAGRGMYAEQWRQAQRILAARRRVRDFAPVPESDWCQRALCSLAPRWPAERKIPPRVPRHEEEVQLSVVGWVKRRWARLNGDEGFPSTASIASAPYRLAVLEHLADDDVRQALSHLEEAGRALDTAPETPVPGLRHLIPGAGLGHWLGLRGGPWVYPDRWQASAMARELGDRDDLAQIADAGRSAARDLLKAMANLRVRLSDYLAVVVQDIDSMGRFLGGDAADAEGRKITVSPNEHRRLSRELVNVASAQRRLLRSTELLSVPVYAGGDDLLAFTPAVRALETAEGSHQAIPPSLPRASSAVLYFHYHASIQQAMRGARQLLDDAKKYVPGKHGLAVGYVRRSGASAVSLQPWSGAGNESSAGLFGLFARGRADSLSPRLVADLERDAGELAALAQASGRLYRAELARLVARHTGGGRQVGPTAARVAEALDWLGRHEYAPDEVPGPHAAARVGVFLRQEAR